jgi:hypothetical protein
VTVPATTDTRKRREKAERAAIPPEQLKALNLCATFLSALEPKDALVVVTRLQRSLVEHIAIAAKGGW